MPLISIIIPVYNEEGNINLLYKRLSIVANSTRKERLEFIFIDDGSTDHSRDILEELSSADISRVKVIRFSRNFGSHAAVSAGLDNCRGDSAIIIAADLQDPPELIPNLIDKWRQGYSVVWVARENRADNLSTKMCASIYYKIMQLIFPDFPRKGMDVVLIDRMVIDALKNIPERNTSLYGLIFWLGFKQGTIGYNKEKRYRGKSKWALKMKLKLMSDSIFSFTGFPVYLIAMMGLFVLGFAGLCFSIIIFFVFIKRIAFNPWGVLPILLILLLIGLQSLTFCILGEYLRRILDQGKGRPRYVIEKRTNL